MNRDIDPHRMLERALLALLDDPKTPFSVNWSRPWASITFSGFRHVWQLEPNPLSGFEWSDDLRTRLQEHEFALPGHIVADIHVEMINGSLRIEALTVEIC